MAITKAARPSKVDAFVKGAPDARPARNMRGRKSALSITLPPDLIAEYDDIASAEIRSRARMMEVALREWAAQYRARSTAA
jgi:uncharacterized membrane protein